jgi:hypothetical protein
VPLERLDVTEQPRTPEEARAARAFRGWGDPLLFASLALAAIGAALLLRNGGFFAVECAAGIVLLGVALLVPHGAGYDLWGTWGFAGVPPVVRVLVLGAGLVPWVFARFARAMPPFRAVSPWIAAGAALAACWLLRERRFWGDAWITIGILDGTLPVDPFGPFFWKEPLDRLIAVAAARVAATLGHGAAAAVAATSCLAGAIAAALLACEARRDPGETWTAALVLGAGASVVYFGHVENYSWVSAATIAFLLLARRAASGDASPLPAGLAGGLAIALHPVAVFAVAPALASVAALRPAPAALARLSTGAIAVPAALLIGGGAAGIAPPVLGLNRFADDPSVLMAPGAALSPAHLAVVGNRLLVLLSPGIALAGLAGLAAVRRPAPASLPLLAAAAGSLVGLLFLHGKIRPHAQDWDLFAPMAVPLALAAARALRAPGAAAARAWCAGVSAATLLLSVLSNRAIP